MIDRISQAEGIVMNTIQSKSLLGIGAYLLAFSLFSFQVLCNEWIDEKGLVIQ